MGGMDHTTFLRRLGTVVKQLRISRQKTQEEVANEVGMNQSNLSKLERGAQGFDSKTIFDIGQTLSTPLHEIFHEVEKGAGGDNRPLAQKRPEDEEERELLRLYRTCNRRGREIILSVAEMTIKANPASANVVSINRPSSKRPHKKVRSAR